MFGSTTRRPDRAPSAAGRSRPLAEACRIGRVATAVAMLLFLAVARTWAHGDARARMAAATLGLSPTEPTSPSAGFRPTRIKQARAGGKSFLTVSLAPLANVSLEPRSDWQDRIWKNNLRQLPRGRQVFAGVPSFVLPPGRNQG